MYSAVKVKGKKLYEYARAGIEVERPSRIITISELVLLSDIKNENNLTTFRFRVTCSKGTYVRTLAVMIGEKLGYPAHMSHLIRTKSGEFDLQQCLTFEEVEEAIENGRVQESLLSIGEALKDLPKLIIHDTLIEKVKNGAVLELPIEFQDMEVGSPIAVYDDTGSCLAIYAKHPTKQDLMKPTKVLMNE
jgi:tRNA pseudouridine55 synthase